MGVSTLVVTAQSETTDIALPTAVELSSCKCVHTHTTHVYYYPLAQIPVSPITRAWLSPGVGSGVGKTPGWPAATV